ncbi:LysR family transcriptional regulator [Acinetobacter sp. NIPH 2699]|uniref:LysR family transcriptional regulator n=1 Tax=Acinetobacter sp. NIPH 2699 TaxID=2923433 RepID=UPI001F4BEC91|nr:LysR family transcriptional regulator [Acinetobacter sp. NIPH 2699]MCH7337876.1 LysR family transcriptional regulator [Acinetobacter sp. NIPH 2699]
MDTLKAIQVFVCIAHQGNLSKAAKHLDYSKAMVSRYLEHLEHSFSTRLFQRNTRKVSLTPAGEKALVYCENILQQQQLLASLAAPEQHSGTIRFTCGLFLFQLGVNECIRQFKKHYPHIHFDVYLTEDTLDLMDAQVDLALRITQKVADGLIARPVCQIESTFCAHPHYLQDHPPLSHPSQLIQHECIAHYTHNQYWTLFDQDQQPQNYPLNVTFKSNDVIALYQMCLAAQGIAMLPTFLIRQDIVTERLQQVFTDFSAPDLTLSLVYASRQHLPKITQEFIAFVIENLSFYLDQQN